MFTVLTSGGATLHCSTSGIVDHFALDEEASFAIARDVIASLNIDEDVSEYGKADFILQGVNSIGYFALLKLGDLTQSCPSPSFICLSPSRLLLGPNFG